MLTHCDQLRQSVVSDSDSTEVNVVDMSVTEAMSRLMSALSRESCPWLGYLCGQRFQVNASDPWAPMLEGELVESTGKLLLKTRFCESPFHRQFRRAVVLGLGAFSALGFALAANGLGSETGLSRFAACLAVACLTAVFFVTFEACELLAHHLGKRSRRDLERFRDALFELSR